MEQTDYKERLDELQRKYLHLSKKVVEMMDTQQMYFKSNKDFQLLKKSKGLEAEVREIINPKPVVQASIDWLGQ